MELLIVGCQKGARDAPRLANMFKGERGHPGYGTKPNCRGGGDSRSTMSAMALAHGTVQ